MNGFTENQMKSPETIEKIELVLEEVYQIDVFKQFINLKSLTLINIGIKKISVIYTFL